MSGIARAIDAASGGNSDGNHSGGTVSAATLELLVFTKLFLVLPKVSFFMLTGLVGLRITERDLYTKIEQLCGWAEVKNLRGTESGGFIGNILNYFTWIIGYYTDLCLWQLPEGQSTLLFPLFMDNRTIWGKNLLIAWGPRHVAWAQSPNNTWPLAVIKWRGKENYTRIAYLDLYMGIGAARTQIHNSVRPIF